MQGHSVPSTALSARWPAIINGHGRLFASADFRAMRAGKQRRGRRADCASEARPASDLEAKASLSGKAFVGAGRVSLFAIALDVLGGFDLTDPQIVNVLRHWSD